MGVVAHSELNSFWLGLGFWRIAWTVEERPKQGEAVEVVPFGGVSQFVASIKSVYLAFADLWRLADVRLILSYIFTGSDQSADCLPATSFTAMPAVTVCSLKYPCFHCLPQIVIGDVGSAMTQFFRQF